MGFLVGIISFLAGIFVFSSNLASLFIGLPLALKEKAKKATISYLGNIIFGVCVAILAIVLMTTVLSAYVVWVVIGYFVIPFVIFIFRFGGYGAEAKDTVAREKLAEEGITVTDIGKAKDKMINEIIEELREKGHSKEVLDNIKMAYECKSRDKLDFFSTIALVSLGFTDRDIDEIFKKWN